MTPQGATLGYVSRNFMWTKEEHILFINEYSAAHLSDVANVNLLNITLSSGTKPWVDISWAFQIPNFPSIDKSFRIKCAAWYLVPNPPTGETP